MLPPTERAARIWRRAICAGGFYACFSAIASGQITPGELKSERDALTSRIFTSCKNSSSVFWGPIEFPVLMCGPNVKACRMVFEYEGAQVDLFPPLGRPPALSPADVANGIRWKGFLGVDYPVSRLRRISDGVWGRWEDWRDKVANARGEPGPADVVRLSYKNGQWSEEIGPDVLKLPFIDFRYMIPSQKSSCDDIMNDRVHAASTPEPPPPPKTGIDGFKYLTAIPRQQRQYSGTAEGFARAFPDFMQRAASASGLNVRNYEKEVAHIVAVAQACAEITPQMARTMTNDADFKRWGPKYEDCRSPVNVSLKLSPQTFDASRQRGLVLNVSAYGQESFPLTVLFSRLSSESPSPDPAGDFMIVEARIGKSPPPNDSGFKFLTALPIEERQYTGTVEGFAKALPDFIQRATSLGGLNFQDYAEDVARIIDVARACGEITPQIAPTLPKFNPSPHPASRYEPCMGTNTNMSNLRTRSAFDARHQRGLMLQVSPLGGDWRSGQGFVETVRFDNLTFDTYPDPEPGKPIKRPSRDDYIIVRANIQPLGQNSTGLNSGGLNRPATAGNVNNAGGGRLAPSPAAPLSQSALPVEPSIQEKKLIKKTPPLYPALAKNAAIQGTVKLLATIGTDGLVKEVQLVSGPPLLVTSAMTAVRQWQYEPTVINGSPVTVVTTVAVIFTLP